MATKPPEVLWHWSTASTAHIYWHGFVYYFERSGTTARMCGRAAHAPSMPREIYTQACKLAREVLDDPILRDETSLREKGFLTPTRVASYADMACADLRRNGSPRITAGNVRRLTLRALELFKLSPGIAQAVIREMLRRQRVAQTRKRKRQKKLPLFPALR